MNPIIKVTDLSKQYRIGVREVAYGTLRESVMSGLSAPFRRLRRSEAASDENSIWALQDVSFNVNPGEVVGIIGRNGAGKSTLLKILSRVTEPTGGRIELYGRVGSLLEVGTGFHPELTGRENVYLNASILGMARQEVEKKFDEIISFAEIEKFIDTPVKRYSSGMYLRLAFAVAAHLEPEILIVDEVLAVGDAAFQKKCLGKMGAVAKEGRTVLFVSHNMSAIRSLCSRTILMQQGRKTMDGETGQTVDRYLTDSIQDSSNEIDLDILPRPIAVDDTLRLQRLRIINGSGLPLVRAGEPLRFELEFRVNEPVTEVALGISVQSIDSVRILECRSSQDYGSIQALSPGNYRINCRIDQNVLSPGLYFLGVGARCESKHLDWIPEAMTFEVYSDATMTSLWLEDAKSCVRVPSEWTQPQTINEYAETT
ncbi:MAG: lipopolysaccharide transport system ATP-binding protein [Blastocatellia bacterium]|nr:lipopolysaccharide transport system ATP-binding protein [Blastocatellia bacterium]